MNVKVRTVWGSGMVSIGSPYVQDALDKKEDLTINCKGASMTVPYMELLKKQPRKTEYNDKKFGKVYQLYDFIWKSNKHKVKV